MSGRDGHPSRGPAGPPGIHPLAQPPGPRADEPRPRFRPRLDGLAPRVAAYLSIALLPLGLIALYQTSEYQEETEQRAELALLALTEQGAAGVASAIERSLGASEALGVLADLLGDPAACSGTLRRLVDGESPFDFVGIIPAEGPVTCSSLGEPFELDAVARADLTDLLARPRLAIRASRARTDALVVGMPLTEGDDGAGDTTGYLALTIPRDRIGASQAGAADLQPLRLITFNAEGQVLSGGTDDGTGPPLAGLLPANLVLDSLDSPEPRAFSAPSAAGGEQFYTVAPLIPGLVHAMAIWSPEQAAQEPRGLQGWPLLFPLLMWGVSLVVAFWAIHRLVIGRVADLGARMRRFGRDRSLPHRPPEFGTPFELREIETAFRQMGESILQDEARMENAFRERGVLLREVHHRVKNNLQLISSIISMQVRRMPDSRVRAILRRLQDRVLTLASIYRSLYTSPDMGDVNAAPVIRAIVEQELRSAEGRVRATLDIEDMVLDPDKVVPLAFLAAEAVSNAVARAGHPEGGLPSLSVTLHRDGERATLRIVNSLSGTPCAEEPSTGLGMHLIQAFAAQVGGPVEIESDDRFYALSITFLIETEHVASVPA